MASNGHRRWQQPRRDDRGRSRQRSGPDGRTEQAAERREYEAFGQQLFDESPTARADGRPDGQLACTAYGASQE